MLYFILLIIACVMIMALAVHAFISIGLWKEIILMPGSGDVALQKLVKIVNKFSMRNLEQKLCIFSRNM